MRRALQPGLNDSATSTATGRGFHHASHRWPARMLTLLALLALGAPAQAAGLDGSQLSLIWAVPFIGVLLSIALCPLVMPLF